MRPPPSRRGLFFWPAAGGPANGGSLPASESPGMPEEVLMAVRAVISARYPSDMLGEDSSEDQVKVCRRYIGRQGWTLIAPYGDRAVSSASPVGGCFPRFRNQSERARRPENRQRYSQPGEVSHGRLDLQQSRPPQSVRLR